MFFAVSVTTKRTSRPSRLRLPGTTMPPMRNVRPSGASCEATCEGVKKNTRLRLNAASTSAVAAPSARTPSAIHAMRLCLGFTLALEQQKHFDRERHGRHAVRAPNIERIAAHRKKLGHVFCPPDKGGGAKRRGVSSSTISQRTRTIATAMLYIQNASAMRIMPVNMVAAMRGARVKLTDAPWCRVFHHCTE